MSLTMWVFTSSILLHTRTKVTSDNLSEVQVFLVHILPVQGAGNFSEEGTKTSTLFSLITYLLQQNATYLNKQNNHWNIIKKLTKRAREKDNTVGRNNNREITRRKNKSNSVSLRRFRPSLVAVKINKEKMNDRAVKI